METLSGSQTFNDEEVINSTQFHFHFDNNKCKVHIVNHNSEHQFEYHVVYNLLRVHSIIKMYPRITTLSIAGNMYDNLVLTNLDLQTLVLYNTNVIFMNCSIYHAKIMTFDEGTYVTIPSKNATAFGNYPVLTNNNTIFLVTGWIDPNRLKNKTICFECVEHVSFTQSILFTGITSQMLTYNGTLTDINEINSLSPKYIMIVLHECDEDIDLRHVASDIFHCVHVLKIRVDLILDFASHDQIKMLHNIYVDNKIHDHVVDQLLCRLI